MTTASAGSVFTCMQVGERYFMGPLRGNIGRASYDFNIEIYNGFKGPGTYQSGTEVTPGSGVASLTVHMVPTPPEHYSPDESKQLVSGVGDASIVLNNDKHSGTVDASLSGRSGKTHVSGTWRCPPE